MTTGAISLVPLLLTHSQSVSLLQWTLTQFVSEHILATVSLTKPTGRERLIEYVQVINKYMHYAFQMNVVKSSNDVCSLNCRKLVCGVEGLSGDQ